MPIAMARWPLPSIARAASAAPAELRSRIATEAPAPARCRAISRPMPSAAPVTAAALPSKPNSAPKTAEDVPIMAREPATTRGRESGSSEAS